MMDVEGRVRGIGLKDGLEFIKTEESEEGLRKVERIITDLGYPLKLEEINMTKFYPLGIVGALFMVAQEVFGWGDEQFRKMGEFSSRSSSIIRLFMKYFVSLDRVVERGQSMWDTYFNVGRISPRKVDKEGKEIIMELKNFSLHPLHCQYLRGYFSKMFGLILKTAPSVRETKCVHKGDDCHEFVIRW